MLDFSFNHKIITIALLCLTFSSFAQRNYWTSVNESALKVNATDIVNYDIDLREPQFYELDKTLIENKLSLAPNRMTASNSDVSIKIPNALGTYDEFEMFKVNTLADNLAEEYPSILSFAGKSIDAKNPATLRITLTPFGFYAMVQKPDTGQFFINPYDKNADYYVAFEKSEAIDLSKPECFFDEVNSRQQAYEDTGTETKSSIVDDGNLRTYRLALACTGEYAQFHIDQAGVGSGSVNMQVTAVLSAMTVTIDRVNSIYEIDLGSTLQLIANNDQLIFLDSTADPYTNNDLFALLSENQSTIDNTIFSANYDIGHVVSTNPSGGVAQPASLCVNNLKARGVTGGSSPVGDPFDVDYVSHEIGHQFGASHTFNNFCGGARTDFTAYEPGSGNTIMAYAGICPPNVQLNSDAHFHQISINQIYQNISNASGSFCGTFSGQSNTAPALSPLPNYTIPNGTAFYLEVSATDAEDDALTYNWEQYDNDIIFQSGQEQPPLPTSTAGPNFKSLVSKTEPRRYFPDFQDVLNGNLSPTWEVVPTVSRSMEFVVTVRDNNINVGQSSRAFTTIDFSSVGPFQVTSQNSSGINWLPGESQTITWDVAGTTGNGINTSNVNILLSTDGGENFDTVLVSNTPNDGSEDIVVPSLQAALCRIMIEPVDNIYYALNEQTFSIDTSSTCEEFPNTNSVAIQDGLGTPQNPDNGPVGSSTISISDDIENIIDINITLDVSHDHVSDLLFQLYNQDQDFVTLWSANCSDEDGFVITFNDNASNLPGFGGDCSNPVTGTFAPANSATSLSELFSEGTQGSWTLFFADFINQNTGTLNAWEIEICSSTFSVQDNQLNDFSISPNPNTGVFELNFYQPLDESTKIFIYDIRGRLVEKLNPNTNSSTMRVELQNQYQSGVYLLEVATDNAKSVSKLIIK